MFVAVESILKLFIIFNFVSRLNIDFSIKNQNHNCWRNIITKILFQSNLSHVQTLCWGAGSMKQMPAKSQAVNSIALLLSLQRDTVEIKSLNGFRKGLSKLISDGIPKLCPELWEIDFVSISVCDCFCSQRNYTHLGHCWKYSKIGLDLQKLKIIEAVSNQGHYTEMVLCVTNLTFICQNIDLGSKVFQALVKSSMWFYLKNTVPYLA